jgi:hypothetical protein
MVEKLRWSCIPLDSVAFVGRGRPAIPLDPLSNMVRVSPLAVIKLASC